MHWKKIIPVVFFGIFLVSQLVTSSIYAQEKDDESGIVYLYDKIPVELASFYLEIASALFFAITTGFLIVDYFGQEYETRLQVRQMRDDSYGRIRDHHHDLIRLQIEHPELMEIFEEVKKSNEYEGKFVEIKLNQPQMRIFNFYLAEFDLYERVYLLLEDPAFEKVDAVEWITWLMYLEQISHHWLFKYTYEKTRELFYDKMMNEIKRDIIDMQPYAKKHLQILRYGEEKVNEEKKKEEKQKKEVNQINESIKETIRQLYKQGIRDTYTPSEQTLDCYGYLLQKGVMSEDQIRDEIKKIKTNL